METIAKSILGVWKLESSFLFDENTVSLCTEPAEDVFGDGRSLYHEAKWTRVMS